MKKLLLVIVLFSVFGFVQRSPQMTMVYGEYLPASCADSVDVPLATGENLSVTKTVLLSGTTYDIVGSSASSSFHIKFKDSNNGVIANGDPCTITQCDYTICGVAYNLLLTGTPTVTVTSGVVDVEYSDCVLPLNGTNGKVRFSFTQ